MERPRGEAVIPVAVVTQETNGGEPKTDADWLLSQQHISLRDRKRNKRLKVKIEF